jgi:tRNA-2-methylthio-N6-dimethylallyladenosine synthase
MPDPISRQEKGKWFSELLAVQEEISKQNYADYVGTVHTVLCEEVLDSGKLSGKTLAAVDIEFSGDENLLGSFVDVRVDEFTKDLKGTIV